MHERDDAHAGALARQQDGAVGQIWCEVLQKKVSSFQTPMADDMNYCERSANAAGWFATKQRMLSPDVTRRRELHAPYELEQRRRSVIAP